MTRDEFRKLGWWREIKYIFFDPIQPQDSGLEMVRQVWILLLAVVAVLAIGKLM